jgi:hypothetical protein
MRAIRSSITALLMVLCAIASASVTHAAGAKPVMLVWSRDVPATLRMQHRIVWSFFAHDYDVRFLEAFPQPLTDHCQPNRLTAADLAAVDVLVLGDWDGTVGCGSGDVDANVSAGEISLIERYVANGGRLFVVALPLGRSDQDNLPELLARFGLRYAHTLIGAALETPRQAQGELNGRPYHLSLSGRVYAINGGTSLARYQNHSIATLAPYGRGALAFLGASRVIGDDVEQYDYVRELNYPPALLAHDNAAFVAHLVGTLAGRELSPTDVERQLWDARLLALRIAFAGGAFQNDQPVARDQSDVAHVRRLRAGLVRGEWCDLGPACVPHAFEPGDDHQLERAQHAEDRAWNAFERFEKLLAKPSPNYTQAQAAHDEAVNAMNEAFAITGPIKLRRVISHPQTASAMWLWSLGLLPLAGIATYLGRRARRR